MGFPKALLEIDRETWLAHLAQAILMAVPRLTIVLGGHAERVRSAVPKDARIAIVENPAFIRGQLSSLKVGLESTSVDAGAVMVHLVDHPKVGPATFAGMVETYKLSGQPIVVARYEGRRGHPVIFDRSLFRALLDAPEELGARVVVQANPSRIAYFEAAETGVVTDLDTPADVARAGLSVPAGDGKWPQ